jgi:pimeloyl-ACP methyl ester carboxylesterase
MGDSQKLKESESADYSFSAQSKYIDALLNQLGVIKKVTFIAHDWGSALAFYWAYRHPDAVGESNTIHSPLTYNTLYGLNLATHRIANHFLMQIIFICKSYFTKIQNIENPNNCKVKKKTVLCHL